MLDVVFGLRPERPADGGGNGLSDKVWSLLQDCWAALPGARPTCENVVHRIGVLVSANRLQQWRDDANSAAASPQDGREDDHAVPHENGVKADHGRQHGRISGWVAVRAQGGAFVGNRPAPAPGVNTLGCDVVHPVAGTDPEREPNKRRGIQRDPPFIKHVRCGIRASGVHRVFVMSMLTVPFCSALRVSRSCPGSRAEALDAERTLARANYNFMEDERLCAIALEIAA